jgi:hypothetical protein
MLSTTLDEMQRLSNKLSRSMLLESMLNIDWGKGRVTRYSQSKWIGGDGVHRIYKSWLQQGDTKTMLTPEQYEKLSGNKLNQDQIKNWSIK